MQLRSAHTTLIAVLGMLAMAGGTSAQLAQELWPRSDEHETTMLVDLPPTLAAGEHPSNAMVVDRSGRIVAHQDAILIIDEASPRAGLELFAADQDLRLRLQARHDASPLVVVVRVGGNEIGKWSLNEALGRADRFLSDGTLPVDLRSIAVHDFTMAGARAGGHAPQRESQACQNSCQTAWFNCSHTCERFPRPNCEESCDARLNTCLGNCSCPTTTTYATSVTMVTATGGQRCMAYSSQTQRCSPEATGRIFDLLSRRVRTDTHVRTVNCDSSVTDVVTATSYSAATICGGLAANSAPCDFGSNACPYPLCQ